MDDMLSGKSAYLMEDYLKRKFLATWEELCHLLKIPSTIEISHEDGQDVKYSGTSYPEINRRVLRLLRTDEFPDHMDICELVDRCNTKHNLGISISEKKELARKVFKEVGRIIKSRRIKDYRAHFGSHLTDSALTSVDPASESTELLEKLQRSLDQGKEKMQRLVEDFVVKQDVEAESGGNRESSNEEGPNSSEEEDEEEEEEGVSAEEMEQKLRSSLSEEKENSSADEDDGERASEEDEDSVIEEEPVAKKPKLGGDNGLGSLSPDPGQDNVSSPEEASLTPSSNISNGGDHNSIGSDGHIDVIAEEEGDVVAEEEEGEGEEEGGVVTEGEDGEDEEGGVVLEEEEGGVVGGVVSSSTRPTDVVTVSDSDSDDVVIICDSD